MFVTFAGIAPLPCCTAQAEAVFQRDPSPAKTVKTKLLEEAGRGRERERECASAATEYIVVEQSQQACDDCHICYILFTNPLWWAKVYNTVFTVLYCAKLYVWQKKPCSFVLALFCPGPGGKFVKNFHQLPFVLLCELQVCVNQMKCTTHP